MAFNPNELILDRVRQLTAHDLETGEILLRLTQLEDPTLSTSAEGEEVTDAVGALITTMYRAKQATFSATNSLLSLDLAAAQYGTKKMEASDESKFVDYAYEILPVVVPKDEEGNPTGDPAFVKLSHTPIEGSVGYVYVIENNEIKKSYPADGATADEKKAAVAADGTITLPTPVTSGKIYVEYNFENSEAVKIVNSAENFPTAVSVVIHALFRDVCNENKLYAGKIICHKAKLNPESIEMTLTSTGKHPFEFRMLKDYCSEDAELFTIIVSGQDK